MAETSLQDHNVLIITLFKQNYAEEEIAQQLCALGVETTFFEVLHHLETWRAIPCPSPVHSKDADDVGDQPRPNRDEKLGVTCYHGEASHISQTSLANIPSDSSPVEKYQRDIQSHEEIACGFPRTKAEPVVPDLDSSNDEHLEEEVLKEINLCKQSIKNKRNKVDLSKNRFARDKRFRGRGRIQK